MSKKNPPKTRNVAEVVTKLETVEMSTNPAEVLYNFYLYKYYPRLFNDEDFDTLDQITHELSRSAIWNQEIVRASSCIHTAIARLSAAIIHEIGDAEFWLAKERELNPEMRERHLEAHLYAYCIARRRATSEANEPNRDNC